MITSLMKDRVLSDLVHRRPYSFSSSEMSQRLHMSERDISLIMSYFQELGFVRLLAGAQPSGGRIEVLIPAMDFFREGGFEVQDRLIRTNVQKLLLEVDVLKKELSPKALEAAEKITAIGSSILSALRFLG